MADKKPKRALPAEVAEKFECVNNEAQSFLNTPIGNVDLTRITLAQAEKLVKEGWQFLRRKPGPAKTKSS